MSQIIELILNEEEMLHGVDAISIVGSPAIERDFVALSKEPVELAKVAGEQKILLGAALVPNKMIFRKKGDEEFYVYFTKDTIKRVSELFLTKGNQNHATLEHEVKLHGLSVVESWIVEDTEKDKSNLYNMSLPVGSWVVAMKVYNDDVWNDYIKTGKVKGFSIEGYFANKVNMSTEDDKKLEKVRDVFKQVFATRFN
jgi:hypothetical protein